MKLIDPWFCIDLIHSCLRLLLSISPFIFVNVCARIFCGKVFNVRSPFTLACLIAYFQQLRIVVDECLMFLIDDIGPIFCLCIGVFLCNLNSCVNRLRCHVQFSRSHTGRSTHAHLAPFFHIRLRSLLSIFHTN